MLRAVLVIMVVGCTASCGASSSDGETATADDTATAEVLSQAGSEAPSNADPRGEAASSADETREGAVAPSAEPTSETTTEVTAPTCESMGEQACLENAGFGGCFTVAGRRFNEQLNCFETRAFIECVSACTDGGAITYAQEPDGALWRFSSTCIPKTWQRVAPSEEFSGFREGACPATP